MRLNHKQATEENFGKFFEIFVHLIFKGLSRDLVFGKERRQLIEFIFDTFYFMLILDFRTFPANSRPNRFNLHVTHPLLWTGDGELGNITGKQN